MSTSVTIQSGVVTALNPSATVWSLLSSSALMAYPYALAKSD